MIAFVCLMGILFIHNTVRGRIPVATPVDCLLLIGVLLLTAAVLGGVLFVVESVWIRVF